jgi:glycosyltransferase involved in cell wall biosynthesis
MSRQALVVTPCYPRFPGDFNGGFVRDLCMRLAARGVTLMVLAPRSRTMGPQSAPYPVRRFPYLPLQVAETLPEETMKGAPLGRLAQLPPYMASAILHASASEPALIHSHIAIPLGFAASLAPVKAPRIITCHGSDCTLPLDNPVYLPFTRHALKHADAVVTVSHYVEALARRLGARDPETIYLGVDTQKFKLPSGRRTLREQYGIPEGMVVIGTLGRLVRQKNIIDLIVAAEIISTRLDALFLIGGDGPERLRLEEAAHERGLENVVFAGAVHDAPSFLGLIDVFTLTSTREGLSLSLQEAMATGCVPVAADDFGSDEIIVDGVNGFLYPPGDTATLAEKIVEAADSRHVARRVRDTIVRRFDAEAGADRYADLYHRLAF